MIGEIEVVETGTFTSIPTSDGVYFVEGKDIVTVKENGWNSHCQSTKY